MKVVIAGSRNFKDYNLLKKKCDYFLQNIKTPITIIEGDALGADKLGGRYAKEKGYELIVMPADWKQHGKRAGVLRNMEMADMAQILIAFWDYQSPGTKQMIDYSTKKGLQVKVIGYTDTQFNTSYYAHYKKSDSIAISLGVPKWYDGPCCKELAPAPELLDYWRSSKQNDEAEAIYIKKYIQQLEQLNVYDILCKINGKVGLCYETPEKFCHRHILAGWLEEKMNMTIKEL